MTKNKLQKLTTVSLLSALAYLLMLIIRIPIIPGFDFLKFDPKDVIIVIISYIISPMYGIISSLTVSLIEMVTVSNTGIIGFIMNVIATLSFIIPSAILYKKFRSLKSAICGLIIGTLTMTALMILWNYLLTPIYMNIPRAQVIPLLIPVIVPFNLIKGGLNTILTLILYKPLRKALNINDSQAVNSSTVVANQPMQNRLKTKILTIAIIIAIIAIILVAINL